MGPEIKKKSLPPLLSAVLNDFPTMLSLGKPWNNFAVKLSLSFVRSVARDHPKNCQNCSIFPIPPSMFDPFDERLLISMIPTVTSFITPQKQSKRSPIPKNRHQVTPRLQARSMAVELRPTPCAVVDLTP
jgi:hypothetical protein